MESGGLAAVGSVVGSLIGAASAQDVNRETLAFMREQGQNRHQWEVDDLKAAGLNPILSASKGFGGGGSPQAPNLKQPFSAADAKNMTEAIKTIGAQREKIEAETEAIKADTNKKKVIGENYETIIKPISDTIRDLPDNVSTLPGLLKKHAEILKNDFEKSSIKQWINEANKDKKRRMELHKEEMKKRKTKEYQQQRMKQFMKNRSR
jgi:uncharacterized protein YoxC